ncbi:ROK family protein, partial [Streptomyces sp. SID8455]|nr:ROK family protein [Streptomyces sp. SID8455]
IEPPPDTVQEATAVAAVRTALAAGERGEPFLNELADRLALGAAAVVSVLDPGCVLLAGAVGEAGGAPLAARVEERLALMSPLRTEVRAGSLGDGAVLRGALIAARDA